MMNPGDIMYGDNARGWKLLWNVGGDHWIAYWVVPESQQLPGVSTPLHVVDVSLLTPAPKVSDA
jgi:hypothetical protein